MKGRLVVLLGGLCAFALIAAGTARANDQEFVIGLGLGAHGYSETDDVRAENSVLGSSLDGALMAQLYGEWYLFDDLGLGLRVMSLGSGRSAQEVSSGDKLEQTVSTGVFLLTANWVPIGSESYARLGLIGGIGNATYESKVTFTDGATGSDTSTTDSTSGPAYLFGAYVDWGADGFGARFGLQHLETNLSDIDGAKADASGNQLYFDLRWAWE